MKLITPVQPLILTGTGIKPTVPTPSTLSPIDSRFNINSDLMVGQLAYNVDDDIWYYRHSTGIKPFGGGEITTNDVEVWRNDKTYRAGNVFVSYVNPSSPTPQFQTAAIYRCVVNTVVGESPENAVAKWEYQGQSINFDNIEASTVIYDNTASGLVADRVQAALDELASQIASGSSTGTNVGTGEGIYKDNSASVLNFKSLTEGQGITLTGSTNEIEISTNADANAANNVGLPYTDTIGVFKQLTPITNAIELKSLTAGTNIDLTESLDGNRIIIDGPNVPVKSLTNIIVTDPTPNGKGGVFHSLSPTGLVNLRQLVAKDNVNINVNDTNDTIEISAVGEANTCDNLGTSADGSGICDGKIGSAIYLKRIKAGDHINITESTNYIELASDGPIAGIENITGNPLDPTTPDGIFKQIDSITKNAQLRTLVGGDNVAVEVDGDNIRISAAAVGDENAAVNVDDGTPGSVGIYAGRLEARAIALRSLVGQGLIQVTNIGDEIYFNTTAEQNVNSDWDAISGDAEILNKPFIIPEAPQDGTPYARQDASWVSVTGGGGAAERECTTQVISASAQTYTIDFNSSIVKTLDISDTVTTLTLAVSNLSTTERPNCVIIDNTDNTSGLTITLNDQSSTIKFRRAKNEFPGVYPDMNVPAGEIWEMEFENRSATLITVDFLDTEE